MDRFNTDRESWSSVQKSQDSKESLKHNWFALSCFPDRARRKVDINHMEKYELNCFFVHRKTCSSVWVLAVVSENG